MNKEVSTIHSYVKCEINASDNFSKPARTHETIPMLSAKSIKKEYGIEAEEAAGESIENLNVDSSILPDSIEIKKEYMKIETCYNTLSYDHKLIEEHSPSKLVEFVAIPNVKIEEENEYDKEDSICEPIFVKDKFICDYCKRAFTTYGHCQKHIRSCRDRLEGKVYQCDKCDNKFKSQSGFYQHIRRHSGVGLHTCRECRKQYTSPSQLARHFLIHSEEKPHKCTQCKAAFKQEGHLKAHVLTHTGSRSHKCTHCDRSFTKSCNLLTHMRTHTGEKPYKCTICNKAFIQSGCLTQHMKTHTGEKPHQCTVCSQAFAHSKSLKNHMKSHSNKTGNKP